MLSLTAAATDTELFGMFLVQLIVMGIPMWLLRRRIRRLSDSSAIYLLMMVVFALGMAGGTLSILDGTVGWGGVVSAFLGPAAVRFQWREWRRRRAQQNT